MFILIGIENHPDRCLADESYGPYSTYEEAYDAARLIQNQVKDRYGRPLFHWYVKELLKPNKIGEY